MTRVGSGARLAGPLLALLVGVACSSDETTEKRDFGEIPRAPKILGFKASPATVAPGENATLAWTTRDAVSIAIADDAGNPVSVVGLDVASGSVTVSPAETTSYTLTAYGEKDVPGPVSRALTVTVDAGAIDPLIQVFTASPNEVAVGGTVTLAWRTTNATTLTIKDDAGDELALGNASVAEGSVGVKPTRSLTTYTLIANGGGRRATAEVRVAVDGLPRIHRFYVDPMQPVAAGTSIQLLWETSRADRVVIVDGTGAEVVNTAGAAGTHALPLGQTTEFRLTATGNAGTASAVVVAQVGAQLLEFAVEPRVARVGDPITLTWQTREADSVVLTGPGGFRFEAPAADRDAGSTTTNLPERGDYILHAWLGSAVQTWAIFVESTEIPRIRSLTPDHSILTAASDHTGKVILTYAQDGGGSCTLYRNGQAVGEFTCLPTGTIEVEITGTSDLRLVAANHAGTAQDTVHVDAVAPARIPVFTKDPARRLSPDGTVELAWQVTDATHVWMTRKVAGGPGTTVLIGDQALAGSLTTEVASDTIFTLSAENSLGHIIDRELTVLAGTPKITDFKAASRVAIPSDPLLFTWTCDGGHTLQLKDQGGAILKTETDAALIDNGSATGQAPATPTSPNSFTYTLEVRNDAPEPAVATFELIVTDGPLVRSFTASASEIALGSSIDLTWEVASDYADNPPNLVLRDSSGKTYDLAGLDPNSDTVTIQPGKMGRYEFTLTATTAPGTRDSLNDVAPVVVEVTAAPEIVSFSADPPAVFTDDDTVIPTSRLAWETRNAVELSIFEISPAGQVNTFALHSVSLAAGDSQDELDGGTFDVHPLVTTRYVLRIANRNASVEETLTVLANPPVIEKFEVLEHLGSNVIDLIAGETVTLNWETRNASVVSVQPMSAEVTAEPADSSRFVDISLLPGAQRLSLAANGASLVVPFPTGFRFPFDGQFFDRVRMTSSGFLSFDFAGSALGSNGPLPSQSGERPNLAVWWGYLTGSSGSAWSRFDANNRTFTIMWKNWSYPYSAATFDYNFEVVLHENGSFEYRYGNFSTTSTLPAHIDYAKGGSATIGFQNLDGTSFHLVSYDTPFPNGPNHLAWKFDPTTPFDGTRAVIPPTSGVYKLSAANVDVVVSQEIDIRVSHVPAITFASVYPTAPQVEWPITFSWQTSEASRIRLVDEQGNVVCEATDPSTVGVGGCSWTPSSAGKRNWRLEAINGPDRNLATSPIVFVVYSRFEIEDFRVSETFVGAGDRVEVTWSGQGGFAAELYECVPKTNRTACTKLDIAGQDPNRGSHPLTVNESKEFWFRLIDRYGGLAEEATANVWVDIPEIRQFTASTLQIEPGGSATLTWDTTGTLATLTNYPVPDPREIDEPFIDIMNTGVPLTLEGDNDNGYFVLDFKDLPEEFAFPYFDKSPTRLIAKVDGVITFDMTNTWGDPSNDPMPSQWYPANEIAPFWSNLKQGTSADSKFLWKLHSEGGIKCLILQWTAWMTYLNLPSDLTFQVLLWETGAIDFRYANMWADTPGFPLADGATATMGIQAKNGTWGQMLTPDFNTPMVGGLGGRSWRFSPRPLPSGQAVAKPTQSTTYRLCVTNASLYEVCDEKRVVVVNEGDLMISEIMIAPTSPAGEWIELRNLSPDPIDLAGFTLSGSTAAESFTIPAALPKVVQPADFAILARSALALDNGGVSPMVVYDTIELTNTEDEVSLFFGETRVDRLAWTAGWSIPANQSIMLEPSVLARVESANNSPGDWCRSPTVYGGGFHGNPGVLGPGCRSGGAHDFYLLDPTSGMPWIDISQTGAALSGIWDAPYHTQPIALGFTFPYFGVPVTEMTVTKYGAIALARPIGELPGNNSPIPSASTQPNGLVAPMWDDMYNTGAGVVRYQHRTAGDVSVMVVQWNNVAPSSAWGNYGLATFQLQLWETGDIVFAYRDPTPPSNPMYTHIYGGSSTIGLENIAGDIAYQVFFNDVSQRPAYDGRSYRFIHKP